MISLEISDNVDKKWNSRLIDSNLGTIYQTKEITRIGDSRKLKIDIMKDLNYRETIYL